MSDIVGSLIEAVRHQKLGHPEVAETIYRDVIATDPDQSSALYLYGLLQLRDGRAADAARLLGRASRLRGDLDTSLHLGRAYLASGQFDKALAVAEEILRRGGQRTEVLYLHGTALNALGRAAEAVLSLAEAVAVAPGHGPLQLNLGNALIDLDRLEEAEVHIRAAIAVQPDLVEAHVSLGFLMERQGRLDLAREAAEAALRFDPGCGDAHWNLATVLLLEGDFRRGFAEYEWRKRHRSFRRFFRELPGPIWAGEELRGRTLLVYAEQGLGDTIQLARYLPVLAGWGARVVLACSPALMPLLRDADGVAAVVPRGGPLPDYDCWVDQMSLPLLLQTMPDTVPQVDTYLSADPVKVEWWSERLPEARIGLAWAGNPLHSNDKRRSLPPEMALRLAGPGMVSLQAGPRAAEATAMGLIDTSGFLSNFAETAALIASLDLVVTVDTAVAHLAGALGVPVWILLPFAPDWRWVAGRDDSPWYSSARLFRQTAPGDWDGVMDRVCAALALHEAE